jgi:short-subunit dehydrogenase
MEHFDYQKRAIIISGASSRIGREQAPQLAAKGAWLSLAGSGVTVTMIHPGFVASEVHQRAQGTDGKPPGLVDRIALQAIQSGR